MWFPFKGIAAEVATSPALSAQEIGVMVKLKSTKKPLAGQETPAPQEMRLTPQNKKEWYAALYKRAEETIKEQRRIRANMPPKKKDSA